MPRTPPPAAEDADRHGMLTPATPRHGPMFDPDYYTLLERKKAIESGTASSAKRHSRERIEGSGCSNIKSRSRTRTKSGAAPGAPMLTPRETPDKRRVRNVDGVQLLDATPDDNETRIQIAGSSQRAKSKGVARILFPVESKDFQSDDEMECGTQLERRTNKLQIFRDPTPEIDEDPAIQAEEDCLFATSSTKKRSRGTHNLEKSPAGMTFVFRGRKIFRPFPTETEYSDDEFAIAPIRPRVLFQNADHGSSSLESSQRTTSSIIFDGTDGLDSSATSLSSQPDSSVLQLHGDACNNGAAFNDTGRVRSGNSDVERKIQEESNPEEEETDIESYYST